jgi:hypothetical protein
LCTGISEESIRSAARSNEWLLRIQTSKDHNDVWLRFVSPIESLLPQKQFVEIALIVAARQPTPNTFDR